MDPTQYLVAETKNSCSYSPGIIRWTAEATCYKQFFISLFQLWAKYNMEQVLQLSYTTCRDPLLVITFESVIYTNGCSELFNWSGKFVQCLLLKAKTNMAVI